MAFTWSNIADGEIGSSARTKINNLGTYVMQTNASISQYTNITVSTSQWVSDNTYVNFPYKASIPISGLLTTDTALVQFAPAQQESGKYIGADTGSGYLYIWATTIPTSSIILPNVVVLRVV
jgi:hypothetical protein